MKRPDKHRQRLRVLIRRIEHSSGAGARNRDRLIGQFEAAIEKGIAAGAFREGNASGRAVYIVTALVGALTLDGQHKRNGYLKQVVDVLHAEVWAGLGP